MGDEHACGVTLSPKGQVATARCTCGWQEKFRAQDGSSPSDRAEAAAAGHLAGTSAEGTGPSTATASGDSPQAGGSDAHAFQLSHGRDGSVVSHCSCGWRTSFRSLPGAAPAEQVAREASERHAASKRREENWAAAAAEHQAPAHERKVFEVADGFEVRCPCGYTATFPTLGKAVYWGDFHVNANKPWDVGSVFATVAGLAMVGVVLFLVGAAVVGIFDGEGGPDDDTTDYADYSFTDSGGGGGSEEDRCRRLKAWWADRDNGQDVIAGMGDCEDW